MVRAGERNERSNGRFEIIEWVAETGSTNHDLLERAASGTWDGRPIVRVADHQSAGRGRRDRSWHDDPGRSLLMSILLRPMVAPSEMFLLTLAAGIAAIDAAEQVAGVTLGLKWPNDLVTVEPPIDRKVAGILAESRSTGDRVDALVIGIGTNVTPSDASHADLADTSAMLADLAGRPVDREDLLLALLGAFDRQLTALETDRDVILAEACDRSATIGREVRVEAVRASDSLVGKAIGLRSDGALIVLSDAVEHSITAADVVHLRPT